VGVPARADEQSRLAQARQLIVIAHTTDNMRKLFPIFLAQMKPLLIRQGADPKTAEEFTARFSARLDSELDKFVDLAAQVYAREFTEDDLANIMAFYKTPTGEKLISKQPIIAQFMTTVGMQWGQQVGREVMEDYQKEKANKSAQP
jgi:hypothetical protein